jgi:hypothetical protein
MQADPFDEVEFFRAIAQSRARSLLIGRRALIVLGLPLLTADYDFWLHIDDIAPFNACVEQFDLFPNYPPDAARARGRYVLENGEKVDVLVARAQPTVDGQRVVFDDVWTRRKEIEVAPGTSVAIPSIADLIATKRFGARSKDAEDIRMLQQMLEREKQ